MEWDDIIYLLLLFFSIGFGHFIRQIPDTFTRKWISTGLGLLLVFIVSGKHAIHPLFCTLVNAIIIVVNKRSCHLISFAFTFAYLMFFRMTTYFGIPYPPAHTNLVQMMLTLKLVGLAFEVHDAALARSKKASGDGTANDDQYVADVSPSFLDIFHYAFCYVGVLTGPFYSYRTFKDWTQSCFANSAPCQYATLEKLKLVPLFGVLFLLATTIYPLKYAESDEFYSEHSVLYRIWYLTPSFFIFRMRIYTGLVLSECVCTMAGLGAYPAFAEAKSGEGPTKHHRLIKEIASNPTRAEKETYEFETISNIDAYGSDFVPTFRGAMKCWNKCIQYWLAINVYKRLPRNQFRTAITMFVSAYWHGVYAGYYLCICSAPMYLPVEDLYVKLFRKDASEFAGKVWDVILWFFKMQAFSYMAIAFLLLRVDKTFYYWQSIYFAGHIVGIVLYGIGYYISKTRKKEKKAVQ